MLWGWCNQATAHITKLEVKGFDLLASDRAQRRESVIVKLIALLIGVTTGSGHRLGREIAVALGRRRRHHLRARAAAAGSDSARVDARHAEAIRTRKRGRETGAVAILGRSSRLAMLAVLDIGRETLDLLFTVARLQINELHLSLKAPPLLLQILVLKFLFLKLTSC